MPDYRVPWNEDDRDPFTASSWYVRIMTGLIIGLLPFALISFVFTVVPIDGLNVVYFIKLASAVWTICGPIFILRRPQWWYAKPITAIALSLIAAYSLIIWI